jgi:hypothetical protein
MIRAMQRMAARSRAQLAADAYHSYMQLPAGGGWSVQEANRLMRQCRRLGARVEALR